MREILFRGKRVDNGAWAFGYFIEDKWGDDNGNTIYAILQDRVAPDIAELWTPVRVIPETVGQYIGLEDKNGVKIFEGDILTFVKGATRPFRVTWDGICWKMFLLDDGRRIKYAYEIDEIDYMRRSEIIGNIHDNPELLEVNK